MNRCVILLVLVFAVSGCRTVEPKIPAGKYSESATPNFIEVWGEQMRLHIEGVDARDTGTGVTFKFTLWSDGRVMLMVSRSVELLYGYPALEYRWDGEAMTATDPKSNLRRRFARQER